MQDIEKLKARYGELTLQLEIIQNQHLEVKRQLFELLRQPAPVNSPKEAKKDDQSDPREASA